MAEDIELYRRLLLLHFLGPFRGDHIERQCKENANKSSPEELRRSFLEAIAYLCDIEKGGATVTAAALQKPSVEKFVRSILDKLKGATFDTREEVERLILNDAVDLASQRMLFYKAKMVELSKECLMSLEVTGSDIKATNLCSWLQKVLDITDLQQLAIVCYDARGNELKELKNKLNEGDCFRDLAHYVGRLGAHRDAVLTVASAMMKVPSLRQISEVRLVPPLEVRKVTLDADSLNIYDMVKRICQKAVGIDPLSCLHAFVDIEYECDLQQEMRGKNSFWTRVHAELLLVDLFSRKKFAFVDNDKFIGCSKGSCYFCYSWISMHHNNFILPASHNKVILGCRGPDVDPEFDRNGNGAKIRARMCERMVWQLEQDILEKLGSKDKRKHFQHCSTNGSSRAPTVSTFG